MNSRVIPFDHETLNARLAVRMSVVQTIGLNTGPITRALVAEHLLSRIHDGGVNFIESLIEGIEIDGIVTDDDEELVAVA